MTMRYDSRILMYVVDVPETGCMLFDGAKRSGYGAVKVGGQVRGAHVVAWERANMRRAKPGYCIMHTCDVRACVNPEHLVEGSYSDNAKDAIRKGRAVAPHTHLNRGIIRGDAAEASESDGANYRESLEAGQGIRTLDFNLGKSEGDS